MTQLRKMMLEELERRNYSAGTTQRYIRFVERFAQHFDKSPDKLGPDDLRSYQAYLLRDPNNLRLENGPSDIDVRDRFTLSFLYQPTLHLENALARNVVNGWALSGSEIASNGEPVYLGISGSGIFSGSTSATSYGDDGGIYGGAMSSGSGSATNGRPPYIGPNSIYMPGWNDADLRLARNFPIHEGMLLNLSLDAFNALNQTIVQGVNSSYSAYTTNGSSITLPSGSKVSCSATGAAPSSSSLEGCFSPYTGTHSM
ncbi:MAG TPA: phage integrase N-terminal SAM-like domain-containing protein [Terriglobia bacterium]|nr:phage integrase N-terminal SAM-like domain-containing protein [Terriglobia bacterium]